MLAAGAGWKLLDFWGICINFNGVLPGNETVKFFIVLLFWHFSVTHYVSFTKIICISMPR